MRNYDNQEYTIRQTHRGGFQAHPVGATQGQLSRAPVFATREAAQAWIERPMPAALAAERVRADVRTRYVGQYAEVLAHPEFRQWRRRIQELYGESQSLGKLAAAAQRAAVRGAGQMP